MAKTITLQDGRLAQVPDDLSPEEEARLTGKRPGQHEPTILERGTGLATDIDAAVRGAADVVTFGTMDELSAWLSGLTGIGGNRGDYEGNLAAQRGIDKFDEEHNPVARTAGQVAGGVAAAVAGPALPSARAGLALGERMGLAGIEGAIGGGAHGFGSGEGGARERVENMPMEAVTGGAFGAGGAALGEGLNRVGGYVADRLGFRPTPRVPHPGEEFEVDLRAGQIDPRNINQVQFEQDGLQGAHGEATRRILTNQEAGQQDQIQRAGERVAQRLNGRTLQQPGAPSPGTPLLTGPPGSVPVPSPGQQLAPLGTRNVQELGEMALQSVRDAERRSAGGVDAAYGAARAEGGAVDLQAVMRAPSAIRQGLEQEQLVINETLTPYAARALNMLDEFSQLGGPLRNDAQFTLPQGRIAGVTLDGIEATRQTLNKMWRNARTNPQGGHDASAVRTIINRFDDWLEQSGEDGLLHGSDQGLELWRAARQARRQHAQRFEGNPLQRDDDAGRLIQRMIDKDVSSNEVVNAILGASKAGENGVSSRLVRRLQNVLPAEEMGVIRQMAWERTLQSASGSPDTPAGPQAVATAIERMLGGQGTSFGRALYTPEQQGLMLRYAEMLRRTVPPPRTVNTSNSGGVMARAMQAANAARTTIMASLVGAGAMGTEGALLGGGASMAAEAGRSMWNQARARRAIRPPTAPGGPVVLGPSWAPVRPGASLGAADSREDEPQPLFIRIPARSQ